MCIRDRPEPPAVEEHESDINLISGANGEIYETSDMYPCLLYTSSQTVVLHFSHFCRYG